ncbi:hypothetical protein [Flectobacillus major]|uniref:hypothetical protein n=1 Tax=Flectobacillus major TaxID=103 RepID=UPI00047AA257|nr:hypothetical protein [Flectobacillus major]
MRISSIQVLSFSQFEIAGLDPIEDREIEFQTQYDLRLFEETSEIGITSVVVLKLMKRNVNYAEMKTLVKFKIDPLSSVIRKDSPNSFALPDTLVLNLTTIVTGTIRGILSERMKGTVFQNEVFPLVDLNSILQQQN